MNVVWTQQAYVRLAEIHEYVAGKSPNAANRLLTRLIDCVLPLAEFPRMGRMVPELRSQDIRELIQGNYRIVYRVRSDSVEVLTVFEGHRLLPHDDLPPD